jgi:[ribosomal protein S18]-alanine N-acetyltransferase
VLKIRHVQPNDIFPVIALAYETLPERYNPAIFNQFYEAFPEGFLVALRDTNIIGFLIGVKTTPTTARILMLSVKEKNRRQRIGTALLQHFLHEMKQLHVTRIHLEVRSTNTSALAFYKKQGFCPQGIHQCFYQNGEDAYTMTKEL